MRGVSMAAAPEIAESVVDAAFLPLLFLLAGCGAAVSDCCEAARSKAFLLRVVGAVVKVVLSADDETAL